VNSSKVLHPTVFVEVCFTIELDKIKLCGIPYGIAVKWSSSDKA
jgi:hypothetical protein